MIKKLLPGVVGIVASLTAVVVTTAPAAATVYAFDRNLSAAASVSGVIETDGSIGAIGTGNITGWDINLTFVINSFITVGVNLLTSNSSIGFSDIQGNLVATASELLWDFDNSGSFIIVDTGNNDNFWGICGDAGLSFCSGANAEHLSVANPLGSTALATVPYETGSFVVATVAVPEPATFSLFGLGIAGLALASRRHRRP